MSRSYDKILDEIQEIRAKNNKNWMDILRLAFKYSPVQAKMLMDKITEYDRQVSKLTEELGEIDV